MKKLNPILLTTLLILTLSSCIGGYHMGTGDKLNNLKHWKADRQAKRAVKNNYAKY